MAVNRDYFIFGLPVKTEFGDVRFLTVEQYINSQVDLALLTMNKLHIINAYKKINEKGYLDEFINILNQSTLQEMIVNIPEFRKAYKNIFKFVFENKVDENSIFEHSDKLMEIRKLIMEMNCLKEEEVSPNPKVQKAIERSRRVKQRETEKMTITDMATSIVVGSNVARSYESLLNLTIFQFYATFYRIAQFKSYDTTVLYSTVAEKVSVELWSKHIDMFKKESNALSEKEFNANYGGVFS